MLLPQILQKIVWVLAALLTVLYAYQIAYLVVPFLRKRKPHKPADPCRFAILIAARNEEAVLPDLLSSIRRQDYPKELLDTWVIADNCTDSTGQCARDGGAYVVVRHDTSRIGKGYALNYLLEQIARIKGADYYDAYMVIDADNILTPDYMTRINETRSQGYDVFCGYRNSKNFGGSLVSAAHSVWYLHDSTHLNQSRSLLGLPCVVTGTGFGFTRELLKKSGGWQFFTLTEDLQFSAWCIAHKVRSGYNHDAILYDEQPETFRLSWRQRTRWVQGGIQLGLQCFSYFLHGFAQGGKTTYSTMEMLTLTLWGYVLGTLCGILSIVSTYLFAGFAGLLNWFLTAFIYAFLFTLLTGILTMATEWNRVRATTAQKLMGIIVFPLHMIAYIPICATAFFRKFSWAPIAHRSSPAVEELMK